MNWIKIKLEGFEQIVQLNNGYNLYLSPKPYTPIKKENEEIKEDYDTEVLFVTGEGLPSTYVIKEALINLINEYDTSTEVNSFNFNGELAYFNKLTRLGLINSLNLEKSEGKEVSNIWINGNSYIINIDYLLNFLKDLEDYAIEVFNVTQQHLSEVKSLDRNELIDYNITLDYPEKLTFDINQIVIE